VLVKNHDDFTLENFLVDDKINSILYYDPFVKTAFIDKLLRNTEIPVLYLDFDLLYSGYIASEILPCYNHLRLFQPTLQTWNEILSKVLTSLSTTMSLVIIDSLNGLFNIQDEKNQVGRLVASYIMMLVSIAKNTSSYVIVSSMSRYRKEKGWVLSPPGKRVIPLQKAQKILLEKTNDGISLNFLDDKTKNVILRL